MTAVGLFGLAVVRKMLPEACDQRHVPEAVGRRLSCLLRAHEIDRSRFAPGVLYFETGAWSGHHVMSRGGRRCMMPKCGHRDTVIDRRALLLAFLRIRVFLEAHLKEANSSRYSINFYLIDFIILSIINNYKLKIIMIIIIIGLLFID